MIYGTVYAYAQYRIYCADINIILLFEQLLNEFVYLYFHIHIWMCASAVCISISLNLTTHCQACLCHKSSRKLTSTCRCIPHILTFIDYIHALLYAIAFPVL